MEEDQAEEATGVNLANAVDLSESEEEEELEDIIDDFAVAMNMDMVQCCRRFIMHVPLIYALLGRGYPARPPLFLPVSQPSTRIPLKF